MTDNPAELNAAGLQALGRGDASTAAALLARAAAADPASPLLWYNLSTAHSVTGDQAAEAAAEIFFRGGVIGARLQAGIIDPHDLRMGGEKLRRLEGVRAGALHPQMEGFGTIAFAVPSLSTVG